MLSGIYIITRGGIPLYFYSDLLESDQPSDILFSGVITAIQKLLVELNVGEVQSFRTNNYNVTLYSERNFVYAFLTSKDSKISELSLNLLHLRLNEKIIPLLKDYSDLEMAVDKITPLLELGVSNVLHLWEKDQKESEATKKAKESLW